MSSQNTTVSDAPISVSASLSNNSQSNNNSSSTSGTPQDSSVDVVENTMKQFSTTVFVDDADTVQRDESHVDHMDPSFLVNNDTQAVEQRLIDFLSKPIVINASTFSTSDTYTFFNSYSQPFGAFTSAPGAMWLNKLIGYFGIRMDMRFRIVVNANRFQQGRYCIGWVPLGGATKTTSNLKNIAFNNMHMHTIVQRTTVPHVELDLATQTSAELLVPFASTQTFWPLSSAISGQDNSCLGYVNIYPYSPLVAPTGSTTCGYTLYLSLENIKLFGAASPQAGLSKKEVSNKMNGPVSGVASSISKGFKEFANIPLLSDFATPVSWIADRVANVASIFGWSKPTQGESFPKMMILNAPGHTNTDGDSDARALSYTATPGVEMPRGISGTDYDEMDFSFITRKYANFSVNTTIDNTMGPGAIVFTDQVTPLKYIQSVGGAFDNYLPCGFVQAFFRFWRGSMKYRFKFVKTEFHSGRYAICFYPKDELSYSADSYYVNRHIIDLRETVEIEVIIPYISRFPWTPTGTSIGTITIEAVDILTYPASVSSSVNVLVEIAGGDDLEFAVPDSTYVMLPATAAPQADAGDKTNKHLSVTIGNSSVVANPVIASGTSIGDKVTNFRSYLKRFHPLGPMDKSAGNTVTRPNGNTISIVPDAISAIGTPNPTYPYVQADPVSSIGSCYLFWSGGVRVRDVLNFSVTTTPALSTTSNIITATTTPGGGTVAYPYISKYSQIFSNINQHTVIQSGNLNNTITVEIPQYTPTLTRNIADCIIYQQASTPTYYQYQSQGSTTNLVVNMNSPMGLGTASTEAGFDLHNLYRSFADDGTFGCFISIPPFGFTGDSANASFW